jgi:hypothetical protein
LRTQLSGPGAGCRSRSTWQFASGKFNHCRKWPASFDQ